MSPSIVELDARHWSETQTHPAAPYVPATSDLEGVIALLREYQGAVGREIPKTEAAYVEALIRLASAAGRWLIAFDYALAQPASVRAFMIEKIIAKACGLRAPDNRGVGGLVEVIEARKRNDVNGRLLALLFLRLLERVPQLISEHNELRLGVVKLLEEQLPDVARLQEIGPREQTYEKLEKWRTVMPAALAELPAAELGQVRTLEQLLALRQNWMKSIRSKLASAVLPGFLPKALLDNYLPLLFSACDRFSQTAPAEFQVHFENAQESAKSYAHECLASGTYYARAFFLPLAAATLQALTHAFRESDFAKPASLSVRAAPKKYSLHAADKEIAVRLVLENSGKGPAEDVRVHLEADLPLQVEEQYLGQMRDSTLELEIPALISEEFPDPGILVHTTWRNTDGSPAENWQEVRLQTHRPKIDWIAIQSSDPYSLEAVEENEFVGRRETLDQLCRQALGRSVGSAYIFGQRRVGKTSLAKALATRLEQKHGFSTVTIEAGEFLQGTPEATIEHLGVQLVKRIQQKQPVLRNIAVPAFHAALAPLASFLDDIQGIAPGQRWIFVIDEFDLIPPLLYEPGPFSTPLFASIRAISHKTNFGFIMVGGEKMEHIFRFQGEQLNNFKAMRLDYFDRKHYWNDFVELVRRPTQDILEFEDEAVAFLHNQTAGNPYFTKMICREVFHLMVERQDFHVTLREASEAASLASRDASENSFQHFWKDGIFSRGKTAAESKCFARRCCSQ